MVTRDSQPGQGETMLRMHVLERDTGALVGPARHRQDPNEIDCRGMLVLAEEGAALDDEFMRVAAALMAADPRVATVSLADSAVAALAEVVRPASSGAAEPMRLDPGTALAAQPAGGTVAVNPGVLDLVGSLDGDSGMVGVTVLREWADRANHRGLRHVWWQSGRTGAHPGSGLPASAVDAVDALDPLSGLARLVDRHLAATSRLVLSVDASWLMENETGAQVATVRWIEALAARPDIAQIRLCDLPHGRLPAYAAVLAGHDKVVVQERGARHSPADIHWRPYQPDAHTMLSRDRQRGRRVVTTFLDLIDFSNSRYHSDPDAWMTRRRQLRRYARQLDGVTAISTDALAHLATEVPGLEPERMFRTPLGVEHLRDGVTAGDHDSHQPPAAPPDVIRSWPDAGRRPFVLVLGNDFLHKNRDLAIRAWQSAAGDQTIDLVLAGLHVNSSSSAHLEQRLPTRTTSGQIIKLEHVSPAAKTWLLTRATAVLYPTSAEGFGLVPHEAAVLGTPALFTSFGPLAEFLPGLGTADWGIGAYTHALAELIAEPDARAQAVAAVRAIDRVLTWPAAAESLVSAFRAVLAQPPQPYGLWERTEGLRKHRAIGDHSIPMMPEVAARSLHASADGRHWRIKQAVRAGRDLVRRAGKRRPARR
jgi:Family 4 Glycosyltransferase in conflict systems